MTLLPLYIRRSADAGMRSLLNSCGAGWDQWSRELARAVCRVHDRRRTAQRSDLPLDARREEGSTSHRNRLLAFRRWTNDIRARQSTRT